MPGLFCAHTLPHACGPLCSPNPRRGVQDGGDVPAFFDLRTQDELHAIKVSHIGVASRVMDSELHGWHAAKRPRPVGGAHTLQLFMWQRNIVGVAHFIKDCFEVLGALDDAPDDASTSSSSALAAG